MKHYTFQRVRILCTQALCDVYLIPVCEKTAIVITRATKFPRICSLLHYIFSLIHFENVAVLLQSQKIITLFHYSFPVSGRVRILSKIAMTKKQTIEKRKNLNLLNTVPFENGFHFFTEHGKYTGITASSTVEFAEKPLLQN